MTEDKMSYTATCRICNRPFTEHDESLCRAELEMKVLRLENFLSSRAAKAQYWFGILLATVAIVLFVNILIKL